MFIQAFMVLLPFVLQAATSPDQRQSVIKTSDDCPTGVHIIGVRGDLDEPEYGTLQDVVDQLMVKLPSSDAIAIDYPASGITIGPDGDPLINVTQYTASEADGLVKFKTEVKNFAESCSDTKVVVMGLFQASIIDWTRLRRH